MDGTESISEDDVRWLLYHKGEFVIEFSDTAVDVRGIYENTVEEICEGITVTNAVNVGFTVDINGERSEVKTADEAFSAIKSAGLPSKDIFLHRYEVMNENYRFDSDKEEGSFYSKFSEARKIADFADINMDGLIKKYAPVADSIELTTYIFDPKGLRKNDIRKRPGMVRRCTEEFETVSRIGEDPSSALAYLGIPRLTDSLIRAGVKKRFPNDHIYECRLNFRFDDEVKSWMRTFDSDYDMGDFEDLSILRGKELLYDSVSHEKMRFSYLEEDKFMHR